MICQFLSNVAFFIYGNVIFMIFSQQILSGKLLLVESNSSGGFKLKLVITYHLGFVVKIL